MVTGMFITIIIITLFFRFIRWIFNGLISLLPYGTQDIIRRTGHFVLALIVLLVILSAGGFI